MTEQNIPMLLNDFIQSIGKNLMGSDDMVNGKSAFRWDFKVGKDKYIVWFTEQPTKIVKVKCEHKTANEIPTLWGFVIKCADCGEELERKEK